MSQLSHPCSTMFKGVYVCVVCSPKRLSARVSHKYWLDCTCNGFKQNIYSGSLCIHSARLTVVWIFFLPFVCPKRIYWSTVFMFNKPRQPSNTRATIIISRVRLANIIYFLLSTNLVKGPKPAMNRSMSSTCLWTVWTCPLYQTAVEWQGHSSRWTWIRTQC